MPTTVQFRRGTTAQNNSFTGAVGEISIDTDKDTIVVHDGSTPGGSPLLSANGATQSIQSSTTASPDFTLKNTTDDATGPVLRLESDRATPADNDVAGTIEFKASDDAGTQVLTASIISRMTDVTDGTEDGDLRFSALVAGSDTTIATLNASGLTVNSGVLSAPTASTIGNLTLANGSITDSSGTISFGDENLTTTGNITGAIVTYTTLNDGSNNITATAAEINALDGITSTVAELNILDGVTSTTAELNIMDGDTVATSTTLADADRVVVNDAGVMKQVALTDFETYFETALDTLNNVTSASSLATVGTLNSGSITSGFGSIDVGSSAITTTGTITGGIGVFDNIRIDNTAGEIDTSSGNLVIDSAGGTVTIDDNVTVTGNLQLDGNLTVSGTTTSVNTTNIEVQDALLELSKNNSGGSDVDSGILITRGSAGNNAAFYWNEGDDKFKAVLTTSAGTATAITDSSTATIVANLEGNVTGAVTGNASTATALQTARTIALSGDVAATGVSFDGTGNITLTTTIQANSVALGTDTTGNYVASITNGSYITGGDGGSEGAGLTLAVDATSANTVSKVVARDASGNFSAGTITAALSGNATTATTLQTARTIGGVSFNGSANINLPGVNTAGNQNTSGTAAVATTVTLVATNTTAATHYITFVDAATGNENIRTDTDLTYNPSTNVLGTTASAAQYSDLAENYSADAEYEPGTVVSFGGLREITQSTQSHDPRVAGVVSTAPAYLMNSALENGTALALHGRVPCKVIGKIKKGDLIVSSPVAGVAQAMDSSFYAPGCVIGKALEHYDSQSIGTIEVVVGRL